MRRNARGHRGTRGEVNNEARRFVGLQSRRGFDTPPPPTTLDRSRSDKSFNRTEKTTGSGRCTVIAVIPPPLTEGLILRFGGDAKSREVRTAQNGSYLFRNYRDVGSLLREYGKKDEEDREKEAERRGRKREGR